LEISQEKLQFGLLGCVGMFGAIEDNHLPQSARLCFLQTLQAAPATAGVNSKIFSISSQAMTEQLNNSKAES
jgi:hypothetical protein